MIIAIRALLAVVLLVGAYVLMLALTLLYLAVIALAIWGLADGTFQPAFIWAPIGGGLVLLALLRGMIRASFPHEVLPDSVEISRTRAPELWRMVTELAAEVGTRAPDEVRLIDEANAAVTEDARALGLLPGRRRLYLGVPLLVGLPAGELRAVLCHELGHYARGHTRLGPLIYRGSVALSAARRDIALAAMSNIWARWYSGIPLYLLTGYAWLYDWISFAVRRRQEYDADAEAARITGKRVTADALRSRDTIEAAWLDFHTRFLQPARRRGYVPDDPFSAFHAMINDPDYRDLLAEHRQQREHQPPQRTTRLRDSHPSDQDRLAALDRLPDLPDVIAARDTSPPPDLLPNREKLFRQLFWMSRPVPWQDWLLTVADRHAAALLDELHAVVDKIVGRPSDALVPGVVLDLLESGHGARLDAALRLRASADLADAPHRQLLHAAVFTLVGQALVQSGSATWTVPWAGTQKLITRDSTPEELHDLVRIAVHRPAEVSRLRIDLAASNVDVDRPLIPPDDAGKTSAGTVPDEESDLIAQQRGRVKLVFGVVGGVILIAVLISLGGESEDQRPPFQQTVRPLPTQQRPYEFPTSYVPLPTMPRLTFTFPLPPPGPAFPTALFDSMFPVPPPAR